MNIEFRIFNDDLPMEAFILNNPNPKELDKAYREINFVYGRTEPREFFDKDYNLKIVDFRYRGLNEIDIEYRRFRWDKIKRKKNSKEEKYANKTN